MREGVERREIGGERDRERMNGRDRVGGREG